MIQTIIRKGFFDYIINLKQMIKIIIFENTKNLELPQLDEMRLQKFISLLKRKFGRLVFLMSNKKA